MPEPDREVAVICRDCRGSDDRLATVTWFSNDPDRITISNRGGPLGTHFSAAYAGKASATVLPGVVIAYSFRCEDCDHSATVTLDALRDQVGKAWDKREGSHGVLAV